MIIPKVNPADIADIKRIIEDFFIRNPRNTDGSPRQQTAFTPQESEALVNTVLSELGKRNYAIEPVPPVA